MLNRELKVFKKKKENDNIINFYYVTTDNEDRITKEAWKGAFDKASGTSKASYYIHSYDGTSDIGARITWV